VPDTCSVVVNTDH